MDTTNLYEGIDYIKATDNPLSADVGIIRGEECIWLYDVGSSDTSAEIINSFDMPINIVLSHFHPDHIANLRRVRYRDLYVGDNTYRYTNSGTVVDKDILINDGVSLCIFPLPSSHAKGSLGLCVNQSIAFLGDAIYATKKSGRIVYNVQLLKAQIEALEAVTAEYFVISHEENVLKKKDTVMSFLKSIYDKRKPGEAYIEV